MSKHLFEFFKNDLQFAGFSISEWIRQNSYSRPVILYSKKCLSDRLDLMLKWKGLKKLHFALKSNYNPEVLKIIREKGCGLDVVSLGEIEWGLKNGFLPSDIIFSGVGKTRAELEKAIQLDIFQINVESMAELERIAQISSQLERKVSIGLRINPEIDAKTHPNIATALTDSKFGLSLGDLKQCTQFIEKSKGLDLRAISYHLGSQIVETPIFREALRKVIPLYTELQSQFKSLDRLDLGGGLGIDYRHHDLAVDEKRWESLIQIYDEELQGIRAEIHLEMGRFIVARSAIILSQVQYIKRTENKNILILDLGMNNLLRPCLYQAYHEIYPVQKNDRQEKPYMVVGPICESSDVFHKEILLNEPSQDDFFIFCDAGAYVQSMASDYNLQPKAQEFFIDAFL